VAVIRKTWPPLWTTLRMLSLCGYAVAAVITVVFVFVLNDQGQDLLRISAERAVSAWNLLFLPGTAALALTVWYTARLLLGRKFETQRLEPGNAPRVQRWLPRILGVAVPLSVACGLLRLAGDTHQRQLSALIVAYLALSALVFCFVTFRRALPSVAVRKMLEDRVEALEGWYLIAAIACPILGFVLLGAFMIWPVALPQWLGAPAILMLGLAGIVQFGSMALTYLPLARGQPPATAPVLALAVVFGLWLDNHYLRLDDEPAQLSRLPPAGHYAAWRRAGPEPVPVAGREPVIVVAAAGGGVRAAWWTATNLAELQSLAGFGDSLYAISGVSGGSLGAAAFVVLRETLGPQSPAVLREKVRAVLGTDFLSPVVAGWLFPDLAQRFFPVSVRAADRQRFLELSWERAVGAALGPAPNPFAQAFTDFYAANSARPPALLLNATLVASGRRAIVSNIDTAEFTDSVDLLAADLSTRAVRFSAAVGASARFTYVSPAGTLTWTDAKRGGNPAERKLRLVDGGYFENSGAATAADLLVALLDEHAGRLFPILVLIRNDPGAPPVCRRTAAEAWSDLSRDAAPVWANGLLDEVSAPVRALLNARTARARIAEVDAARLFEANGGAVIELPLAAVLQTAVAAARGDEEEIRELVARAIEPPLGWSLSGDVRDGMDRVLTGREGGLGAEYSMLEGLLEGNSAAYVPCRAR
jgi:hypothetical protein